MTHNENFRPRPSNLSKAQYVALMGGVGISSTTRKEFRDKVAKGEVIDSSFVERIPMSGKCTPGTYYRKISDPEYAAIKGMAEPFTKTFAYTDTDNYRYFISSSLKKVEKFGNANETSSGGVIIKLKFRRDLRKTDLVISPHQILGAGQAPKAAAAMHREGFAMFGNLNTIDLVTEVINEGLDHNLGFTVAQKTILIEHLISWEKITP